MVSSEVSWQSAFWSLPPLAINSMMQPWGRVCGFDPSLRTYLRSSPIVCAFDAVTIIIRFIAYSCLGHSAPVAAKKVIVARCGDKEETELGGIQSLEQVLFLRCVLFVICVLPQTIKLMACFGLPWTQLWGCFYLVSFIVVEVMNTLAVFAVEELDSARDDPLEHWITLCERICGAVAVLLQLTLLSWFDLPAILPDSNLIRTWEYQLFRLSANFAVFLIYIPLITFPFNVDAPLPSRLLGGLLISMLLINVLLLSFQRLYFTQLFHMYSILISYFSWSLDSFPVVKTHVLFYKPGNRGYGNVLAFDFFCRILCFSLFWYAVHYDPTGTFKPE